jgi:hypothetical protein
MKLLDNFKLRVLDNFELNLGSLILGSVGTLILIFFINIVYSNSNRFKECVSESSTNDSQLNQKIELLKKDVCGLIVIPFENQHNIWRFINYSVVGFGFIAIAWFLFTSNEKESVKTSKVYILYFAIFFYSLKSFVPFDKYEVASALLAGEGRKIVADLKYKVKNEEDFNQSVEKYKYLYDIAINRWQDIITNSNDIDKLINLDNVGKTTK